MPHTAADMSEVLLDLHAAPAAVPLLAASQLNGDVLLAQLEAGRDPLDDQGQAGAVRFTGSQIPEHDSVSIIWPI